ncbi:hypothetical protein ACJX0J_024866, partial [Zea mays]
MQDGKSECYSTFKFRLVLMTQYGTLEKFITRVFELEKCYVLCINLCLLISLENHRKRIINLISTPFLIILIIKVNYYLDIPKFYLLRTFVTPITLENLAYTLESVTFLFSGFGWYSG